ncbi:unnamed protein product [Trichobilharzia szidati]|nr:unnamed protein product [Trichobilharzia szidati]
MENHENFFELEERIKVYEAEIKRKDELIQKLSSMDIGQVEHVNECNNHKKVDESNEQQQTLIRREELAVLRSKVEQLCEKTLSQDAEIKAKSTLLTKAESDIFKLTQKQNELLAENEKLHKQLADSKTDINKSSTEFEMCNKQLNELKQLLKNEQDKTDELKKRLTKQLEEKENADYKLVETEKRLENFITKMIHIFDTFFQNKEHLNITEWNDERKLEDLITKAKDVVNENLKNKGYIQDLMDRLQKREAENAEQQRNANRLGELLTKNVYCEKENKGLTQELEYIRQNEKMLEDRCRVLSRELIDAQIHIRELEKQLAESTEKAERHSWINQNRFDEENALFRNSLASMLSHNNYQCSPTEISIKETIRKLMSDFQEQKDLCSRLEVRLSDTQVRLDNSQTRKYDVDRALERTERECLELREQIRRLETDLTNSDLIKQEQRSEKLKIFSYLCQLAAKVRIDEKVASAMRFDELQEVLATRIGQIVSGEYAMLSDVQANADRVNGLNRKVKRLQDKLASREIQLGLWKEKAGKLEDQLSGMNETEMKAHANKIAAEKSAVNARRSELEASRLKDELTRLKADLLDFSDAKINLIKYEEKIAELTKSNKDLECIRQSQANKIAELSEKLEIQTTDESDARNRLEEECKHLMSELQSMRKTLEQLQRSERELLEFRALVGRLLGLDVELLTIPNYDIISRLESIITHHQFVKDNSLTCMHDMHSPSRKSRPLTKETGSYRCMTAEYMAGPHTAKTRSKQAWVNTSEDSSRNFNWSSCAARDSSDKRGEKSCLPEGVKHDPRKY